MDDLIYVRLKIRIFVDLSILPETRWKRAGRTVPIRDPLKLETPFSTMARGWRPSKKSARLAMRPPVVTVPT